MPETTAMVSTAPNDRQILNLQIAESCTEWIVSFVAKCRAEKKADTVNNDGTIGESDDIYLARLREEALFRDFQTLNTKTNPETELVKYMFISGLRDPEAKLRLVD